MQFASCCFNVWFWLFDPPIVCRCVDLPAAEEVEVEAEQCTVAVDGQDCQQVVATCNQEKALVGRGLLAPDYTISNFAKFRLNF